MRTWPNTKVSRASARMQRSGQAPVLPASPEWVVLAAVVIVVPAAVGPNEVLGPPVAGHDGAAVTATHQAPQQEHPRLVQARRCKFSAARRDDEPEG